MTAILSNIRLERDYPTTVHVFGTFNMPLALTEGDHNAIVEKIFKGIQHDEPGFNQLEKLETGSYQLSGTVTFDSQEGLDRIFGEWDDTEQHEYISDIEFSGWEYIDESIDPFWNNDEA